MAESKKQVCRWWPVMPVPQMCYTPLTKYWHTGCGKNFSLPDSLHYRNLRTEGVEFCPYCDTKIEEQETIAHVHGLGYRKENGDSWKSASEVFV